jgi:hypothetical protein
MSQNTKTPKKPAAHAGPRRGPAPDELPQPSYAERTRTLLHRQPTGYLSTHSRRHPSFPFGSVMPYALDDAGRPLFLISKMAMHTQNLDADPRSSLLVPEDGVSGNPLGAARATLVGEAKAVTGDDVAAVREIYLERHESARYWVDYRDFGFYRMEIVEVYYVGGFGVMGWVESEDYASAERDPLADAASGIVEHMNQDHSDALALLARHHTELEAEDATRTAVDRLGFHLRFKAEGRYQGRRVNFPREVRSAGESREVLIEMVRAAREG